ncbi:DNA polymerase III subunit delta [Pediococcus stilesii]|uniref:DNA polymerase III subunit delta n=1 Tax=Pediococcus stilesii TaxID=331679 RepID=A0A0R2L619_9LACO|nr:DNA polymerase III subunit delta [Pediococcus stilesii]KRN94052.1 DNA polymerase III, delta subunit [Pediococcus stilesii]
MKLTDLKSKLKKRELSPIYLVDGVDGYIQETVKKSLMTVIPEDQRVMNIGTYDLETVDLGTVLDDARSAPFFGDYRLIVLNNPVFLTGEKTKLKFNLDGFLNYIKDPEPTTILLISAKYEKLDGRKKIVKDLKKIAETIDASAPKENDIKKLVLQYVSEKESQITDDAIGELILRTDGNLSQIINELKKLTLYASGNEMIDLNAVQKLVPRSLNQNVFDLINVLMQGNIRQSIDDYSILILNQEQPLRINAALVSQFRLLLQVKILMERGFSQGKLAQELKAHPYRIKLAMQSARKFKIESLQRAYLGLINLEEQLKTTQRDPKELFELFLVKFRNGWS